MNEFIKCTSIDEAISIFKSIYNSGMFETVNQFIETKKNFIEDKDFHLYYIKNDELICLIEGYDLQTFPVPIVEKNVFYINCIYVNEKYKTDTDLFEKCNSLIRNIGEKYSETMFMSSPVNDSLNAFFKHIGFAPMMNYENYATQSIIWLFEKYNSLFIKRIPINMEHIRDENIDPDKINFKLICNFQQFFHFEILQFINMIKRKYPDKVLINTIEIKSKEDSVRYGTDFSLTMDNKSLNPVTLMKFDFDEYIKLINTDY